MEMQTIETQAANDSRADFTCEPKALADAGAWLAKRIIDRRDPMAILTTIHIAADPRGFVTLTATNLDQWGRVTVPATVHAPGTICCDAALLGDVLAKARKDKAALVSLRETAKPEWHNRSEIVRAVVSWSRSRFNVPTLPAADFPLAPIEGIEAPLSRFTVPAGQFAADLASLAPCIGSEYGREYLHGVAMQRRDLAGRDRLVMVATCGKTLGVASRPLPDGAAEWAEAIIPTRAVAALIAAAKLPGEGDAVTVTRSEKLVRFDMPGASFWTKRQAGEFPDWSTPFGGALSATGAQEALFPELLPGAPMQAMEGLGKATPGIVWQPARQGQLGTVAHDPGLLFGCLDLGDDAACAKPGFSYRENGEGEIVGPDGVAYPVAFSDKAIGLTREQVRALIGESCFETMEVTRADGRKVHILKWLWDDGALQFGTVQPDGRCFPQVRDPSGWGWLSAGEVVTRAEIEAGADAVPENACQSTPQSEGEGVAASGGGERANALSEAVRGCDDISEEIGKLPAPPIAATQPEVDWHRLTLEKCERADLGFTIVGTVRADGIAIQRRSANEWAVLYRCQLATGGSYSCPPSVFRTRKRAQSFADWLRRAFGQRLLGVMCLEPGEREAIEEAVRQSDAPPPVTPSGGIAGKQRTPAHLRAIRAYLELRATRRERDKFKGWAETSDRYHGMAGERALVWQERSEKHAQKRRRAVLLAREFQKRLYAEYRLHDRRIEANMRQVLRLTDERDAAIASRERCNDKHWQARGDLGKRLAKAERERDFERARADTLAAQLARFAPSPGDRRKAMLRGSVASLALVA